MLRIVFGILAGLPLAMGSCASTVKQDAFSFAGLNQKVDQGGVSPLLGVCATAGDSLTFYVKATCPVNRPQRIVVKSLSSGSILCDWNDEGDGVIPRIPTRNYQKITVPDCHVAAGSHIQVLINGSCSTDLVSGAWDCVARKP